MGQAEGMGSVAGTSVGLEREKAKTARFGRAGESGGGEGAVGCAVTVAEHMLADGCLDGSHVLREMEEFR